MAKSEQICGLTKWQRASKSDYCLSQKAFEVGVKVVSLTCNGPLCHFSWG